MVVGSVGAVAPQPHIFMVLVDDWGWNDVGFHHEENRDIRTPNIDALVQEGIKLDRHYVYSWCAPTRSSLQSGRLPVHVTYTADPAAAHNPDDPVSGYAGIPRNMTGIASKMRAAGYRTHMTGKWDAGMATWDHTPMGRGYESFFGYYQHANDYYEQTVYSAVPGSEGGCDSGVDLWDTAGPAYGRNGTAYEEELFTSNTLAILEAHDPAEPLFLFHSFHIVHTPLQVPEEYESKFQHLVNKDHRKYAAMVFYMDEQLGVFVDKFRSKGMWENTLMVLSSDNGGAIYGGPFFGHQHPGASNAPLRGGKLSDFEGGIRVNAFVAGGFLPEGRRGSVVDGYIHVSDWYTTFCSLAGIDAVDDRAAAAGLPPVDGINQWPLIAGETEPSGHSEIHVSEMTLIQRPFKIITGSMEQMEPKNGKLPVKLFPEPLVIMNGKWPGYGLQSDVGSVTKFKNCFHGCLYNIETDPGEDLELVASNKTAYGPIRDRMKERLAELNKGLFRPHRGDADPAACDRIIANGGFFGPWVDMPEVTRSSLFVV
jgi:arylsulfatase I/J